MEESKKYWTKSEKSIRALELILEKNRKELIFKTSYYGANISEIVLSLENYPKNIIDCSETFYMETDFSKIKNPKNITDILEKLSTDFHKSIDLKIPKETNWSCTSENIMSLISLFTNHFSPVNKRDFNNYLVLEK